MFHRFINKLIIFLDTFLRRIYRLKLRKNSQKIYKFIQFFELKITKVPQFSILQTELENAVQL